MKVTEQYFHVVQFITLCMVVLTLISVDRTLVCDHDQMKTYITSLINMHCA